MSEMEGCRMGWECAAQSLSRAPWRSLLVWAVRRPFPLSTAPARKVARNAGKEESTCGAPQDVAGPIPPRSFGVCMTSWEKYVAAYVWRSVGTQVLAFDPQTFSLPHPWACISPDSLRLPPGPPIEARSRSRSRSRSCRGPCQISPLSLLLRG